MFILKQKSQLEKAITKAKRIRPRVSSMLSVGIESLEAKAAITPSFARNQTTTTDWSNAPAKALLKAWSVITLPLFSLCTPGWRDFGNRHKRHEA